MASQLKPATQRPWGQITAGLLGGLFVALFMGVALSIFWPAKSFDRLFMGTLSFPITWVIAMLVAFVAPSGKQAWLKMGLATVVLVVIDVIGLFFL